MRQDLITALILIAIGGGFMKTEKAAFAAGCFWGIEEAFSKVRGVVSTSVGYSGGKTRDPDYGKVCSGKTGHAETVMVEFDPSVVSYGELLEVFWKVHDPTDAGGQGPDRGSQYRSVIFCFSKKQKKLAEESKERLEKSRKMRVVTSIETIKDYYKAEEYHQKYYKKGVAGKLRAVMRI
jgi:peptide-methionine (S)-S-oxide reductase